MVRKDEYLLGIGVIEVCHWRQGLGTEVLEYSSMEGVWLIAVYWICIINDNTLIKNMAFSFVLFAVCLWYVVFSFFEKYYENKFGGI